MSAPNKYDLAFVRWFESHGWLVHDSICGLSVWTNDDATCHFKVTRGMIERLSDARIFVAFYPLGTLDTHWGLPERRRS